MAEPVDVGIVVGGAGASAHLKALAAVPEARLLAVCAADPTAARSLARERGAQAFGSVDKMLGCDDLDLVVVASPGKALLAQALAAVEAGKHAWVAPPAASAAGLRRLEAAARRADVRLALALASRHHPRAAALRSRIADGRVGQVAMVRYSLRLPSPARDGAVAAHLAQGVDLAACLAGKPPATVFAARRDVPGDYLVAHLALEDNAIATVEVHLAPPEPTRFPPREHLVVVGTTGTLRAGTGLEAKLVHSDPQPLAGLTEALRRMVRHVRGGPPPHPPADARAANAAAWAAARSARAGQPVALRPGGKG